jgi:hypothetical protein
MRDGSSVVYSAWLAGRWQLIAMASLTPIDRESGWAVAWARWHVRCKLRVGRTDSFTQMGGLGGGVGHTRFFRRSGKRWEQPVVCCWTRRSVYGREEFVRRSRLSSSTCKGVKSGGGGGFIVVVIVIIIIIVVVVAIIISRGQAARRASRRVRERDRERGGGRQRVRLMRNVASGRPQATGRAYSIWQHLFTPSRPITSSTCFHTPIATPTVFAFSIDDIWSSSAFASASASSSSSADDPACAVFPLLFLAPSCTHHCCGVSMTHN